MTKKIVAFSAGKVNGNTETYLKIALEEAQRMGCETELIRSMAGRKIPGM